MLAGVDTNVLIDFLLTDAKPTLERVLEGEGWTTAFVDDELFDPREESSLSISDDFLFIEVDPVDARLLPGIQRDQLAIAGERRAGLGGAAGEISLVHVALNNRSGSIILSNDPHAVGLGRRRGVAVRGTLYALHRDVSSGFLSLEDAWITYCKLREADRRPPRMTRTQLETYLSSGVDPR